MWGREKVACWRTKAAISLKRVKIEEKLLWTTYRNSPTLFRMVSSPTLYGLPFLEIGGLQLCNLNTPLISEIGKATDFKFVMYIYRANPNKSLLKIWENMEHGRIQGVLKFLGVPPIISGTGKPRTSNLAGTFTRPIRIKAH